MTDLKDKPVRLNNWRVCSGYENRYRPPELSSIFLGGDVVDHPRLGTMKDITTSPIEDVNGNLVTTHSGTVYELGEPDPNFVEFCKQDGCHIPTKEVPIKFIVKDE